MQGYLVLYLLNDGAQFANLQGSAGKNKRTLAIKPRRVSFGVQFRHCEQRAIGPNAIGRLKRELARVKKERDFLREAATFFARESS